MLKNIILSNKYKNNKKHEEYQYLNLINDILKEGVMINGRNGFTKTIFGSVMHFDLNNNVIPILTTKRTAWKTCLKELLWFISGSTSNDKLIENNVKIWNGNSSREFLDSRGLHNLRENDLGPVYGHQWRHFNANYTSCDDDYTNKGVDQLQNIIDDLKDPTKKYSRRLVMSAWNPCQLNEMALPPCHILVQFNVINNKLSCSLYQRSCDVGLGVPFNIASYCFLTYLICKHCDLEPNEFIYNLGNCHIYDDHIENLKNQLEREPYSFPTLQIKNKRNNINDYVIDDFIVNNYKCHKKISMEMRK
jgi:thymidylate synthase